MRYAVSSYTRAERTAVSSPCLPGGCLDRFTKVEGADSPVEQPHELLVGDSVELNLQPAARAPNQRRGLWKRKARTYCRKLDMRRWLEPEAPGFSKPIVGPVKKYIFADDSPLQHSGNPAPPRRSVGFTAQRADKNGASVDCRQRTACQKHTCARGEVVPHKHLRLRRQLATEKDLDKGQPCDATPRRPAEGSNAGHRCTAIHRLAMKGWHRQLCWLLSKKGTMTTTRFEN